MASPRPIRVWFLLGTLLAGIGIFWCFFNPNVPPEPLNQRTQADKRPGKTASPEAGSAALIRNSAEAFRTHRDPAQSSALLDALRAGLRQAPEETAAAAIVAFLKTREDAATDLPFAVGPDGMMDAVPSLRLALLDLLPSLDPLAALEMARAVMDQRTSPDEYALALRNMAWNDLNGDLRDELSGRFMELLKSPWLEKPSAGYLEAFDIAVEVGGGPMFDRMVSLASEGMAKPNTAASRAAFMSLDRMVVRDHALLTTAFINNPGWTDFAPQQRASLMSRLDISEPGQRDVFSRYLSATPHAAGELEYFAKIFPNENFLHGHRLVTADEATPTIDEVSAADARVLGELDALEAAVPDAAKAAIRTMRERLKRPAK